MRNRGGHRDNPNSVEFRTDYRAVAIDSLFVKSQNTNCIEDIDSFLLKLGNFASSTPSPPVPLPDTNTALPLVSQDLAAVSNMPPNVTPREGNIIVYLAGYVGRKAVFKFKCKAVLPKYCICGLHNLPGIRVQGASSPCHPRAKNRPSFHVQGEGCLQHFQRNMLEHCVRAHRRNLIWCNCTLLSGFTIFFGNKTGKYSALMLRGTGKL